jgi:hypothetical protein
MGTDERREIGAWRSPQKLIERKRPLERRARAVAALQLMSGSSALTRNAVDLDTRDPKIGELTIRKQ